MMEESNQNTGEPSQSVAALPPVVSLGGMLRAAREQMGLSVGDVANQIKFAPRQIEALEADDFSAKPEAAFLRGFVRSYGKFLHLDVDALFAALPETKVTTLSAAPVGHQTIFPNAQTSLRKQNFVWMGAALLLVAVAVGFAIVNGMSPAKPDAETQAATNTDEATVEAPIELPGDMQTVAQQSADQMVVAASAVEPVAPVAEVAVKVAEATEPKTEVKPVALPQAALPKPKVTVEKSAKPLPPQASAPVTVAAVESPKAVIPIDMLLGTAPSSAKPVAAPDNASESADLRIVFGEESWTEVKDKNGKSLSSRVNAGGSELRLKGSPPFTLSIANAKSARLYYKGKQVDLKHYIKKYSEVARVTLE